MRCLTRCGVECARVKRDIFPMFRSKTVYSNEIARSPSLRAMSLHRRRSVDPLETIKACQSRCARQNRLPIARIRRSNRAPRRPIMNTLVSCPRVQVTENPTVPTLTLYILAIYISNLFLP